MCLKRKGLREEKVDGRRKEQEVVWTYDAFAVDHALINLDQNIRVT